jgi:hypothetical protein
MTDVTEVMSEDGNDTPQDAGVVRNLRKKIEYPKLDEGSYPAVCTKVQEKESHYKDAQPGDKLFKLWWETEETYESDGPNGKETKKHIAFSPWYSPEGGEGARFYKMCKALTGKPPFRNQKEVVVDGEKFTETMFDASQFKGMVSTIIIMHSEPDPSTKAFYVNIETYVTTKEEKADNCAFIKSVSEGESKAESKPPVEKGTKKPKVEDEKTEEKKEEKAVEETTPDEGAPSKVEQLLAPIEKAEDVKSLEDYKSLVLEGADLTQEESKTVQAAYDKKLKSLSA